MRAILAVGTSCSGKTTFANELVSKGGWRDINRDWIRFNIVKPGADWSTYKFSNANEKEVTRIQGQMIMESWSNGENIIISDTNLNPKTRKSLTTQLEDLGYTVEVKSFPITREEAVRRDNLRANGVGADVIYKQWLQWCEFNGRVTYTPDESLPKAICVDLDGTLASFAGKRGPFEWDKVGGDEPRQFVIDMVKNYSKQGYKIIICSGRSDECYGETAVWLDKYLGGEHWQGLYMRKAGDFRKDSAVKEEIFWTNLANKYNICGVVDDRSQMIELWWELKIENVICVGNPYIKF